MGKVDSARRPDLTIPSALEGNIMRAAAGLEGQQICDLTQSAGPAEIEPPDKERTGTEGDQTDDLSLYSHPKFKSAGSIQARFTRTQPMKPRRIELVEDDQ